MTPARHDLLHTGPLGCHCLSSLASSTQLEDNIMWNFYMNRGKFQMADGDNPITSQQATQSSQNHFLEINQLHDKYYQMIVL